jgi:hypothetical protein
MRILVTGLVLCVALWPSALGLWPSVLAASQEPTRITVASNIRLRATPSGNAAVVAHLPLGTDLVTLDTAGDGGGWIRVRLPDGQDGWLPTRLTRSLAAARRHEVIESIIGDRLPRKGDGFAARAELTALAERGLKDAPDAETAGRFALHWVRAMSSTLEGVPLARGTRPPYRDWLAARNDTIVYNEPGGRWMIRPAYFWRLHDAHARTASADELAWLAVLNGIPGECEGYLPCHLHRRNQLEGEYLRRSALGAHVGEAVSRIALEAAAWSVPVTKPYFLDPSKDCVELIAALDPLRAAVASTRAEGVREITQKLEKVRHACR